jgi:hypothetical protein
VYEESKSGEKPEAIINMYRQYDGYPTGHGAELAEFISAGRLVNGFKSGEEFVFNGMGCLAASLIANFKQSPGGFYIHPGHTYYGKDISKIHQESQDALAQMKANYLERYPNLVTRLGDTPGCAMIEDFGEVDELGPGNFVFFDLMQVQLGSCAKEDIAVCLAVPVVDIQRERKEILVHGGGVHLAKDVLLGADGSKNFGEIVLLNENGWN